MLLKISPSTYTNTRSRHLFGLYSN